jgi:transcriptional regulator with XRE-family HTH domain
MRIKEVMKEKHLTQQELADRMGISLSGVKKMVGAKSLTTDTLDKIAGAIGVPVWQLMVSPDVVAGSLNGNVINCPHCGKPIKFDRI